MDDRLEQQVDGFIKKQCRNTIKRENLVEKLEERFGLSADRAESKVQEHIRDGMLFEPEPGKVRKLKV